MRQSNPKTSDDGGIDVNLAEQYAEILHLRNLVRRAEFEHARGARIYRMFKDPLPSSNETN